jgi:hypothetical protein
VGRKPGTPRQAPAFPWRWKFVTSSSNRRVPVEMGSGRTIDPSSSGLSFTTNQPLLPGQKLDFSLIGKAREPAQAENDPIGHADGHGASMPKERNSTPPKRMSVGVKKPRAPSTKLDVEKPVPTVTATNTNPIKVAAAVPAI